MSWFRLRAGWLTCLVLLMAPTFPVWADWREHYRAGLEAFESRRWADVVRDMNAALADRSEERAGNSVLVRRYTPRYYLAAAMAEQGDCRGALPVFQEAADLGQIQRTDQFADFKRRQRACETLLSRAATASASAGTAVERAEKVAADAARLSGDAVLAPLWEEGDTSLASLYDQADRTLRQARERLGSGRRKDDLEDLAATQRLAEQAASAFEDLLAEANAKRNAVTSATASALEAVEQEIARAKRALRGVRDLAPYPRELGRRVTAVERLVSTVERDKDGAAPSVLEAAAAELDQVLDRLGQAARRPPKSLLDAGEAFLAGDLAGALGLLATIESQQKAVRTQVCILGTAAAFGLAELAEVGAPLESAQLEEQMDGCRALDELPELDSTIFSPRFVAFWTDVMRAEPEAIADGDGQP